MMSSGHKSAAEGGHENDHASRDAGKVAMALPDTAPKVLILNLDIGTTWAGLFTTHYRDLVESLEMQQYRVIVARRL